MCACACPSWPVRAGRPPGRVVVPSPFSVAGRAALFVCSAPSGLGSPFLFFLCAPVISGVPCFLARAARSWCLAPPPPLLFFPLSPLFFFLFVRPCCLWRSVFCGPGCLTPWRLLVSPSPPPFFFPAFPPSFCSSSPGFFFCFFLFLRPRCLLRSVFSDPGCPGPWRLLVSPPPPLFFFSAFPRSFFSSSPGFFFCAPVVSCVPCVAARGALGLGAVLSPQPPPPLLFFPSCLFFAFCFFFPPSVPCRWCGAGLVCASWAVGCAGVCFGGAVPVVALCAVLSRPSGAGWCCVVLLVVFGCLLLGLAVLRCLLVGPGVVFRWCCPCLTAWLAALWFGVVCLGAPLPCVVFCGAVLSCGGVLSCSAVCLRRGLCLLSVSCRWASIVFVLGSRAVRSLSSAPCAVLCCAVLVPLCCAVGVVCAVFDAWCCWFLVLLCGFGGPLVALVAWRLRLVVCVGLGVRVWPRLPSLSVSPLVSCSPVLSPVALCCRVVLCCGALLSFFFPFFFVPCFWRWLSVSPKTFPVKPVKMVFRWKIN